ncbi:MAG: hypothetical protein KBD21_05790 [Candidatus Pacebacteria bacterium]|nr:hypothetical protein [Candidatus Paceibacterota bacterium]
MTNRKTIFLQASLFLSAGMFMLVPYFVLGQQDTGLVPCSGIECQACHAIELVQRILNFIVMIASGIAVLLFSYAGFLMLTAAGNTGKIEKGKGVFVNVLIGIVIVLAGWLIIDTIMKAMFEGSALSGTQGFGGWNEIQCGPLVPKGGGIIPGGSTGTNTSGGTGTNTGGGTAGCPTCAAINTNLVSCKNSASCTIEAEYGARLNKLAQTDGVPSLQVTEACPATRQHQNSCHASCTCTDIVFTDRNFTVERIQALSAAAQGAGLRAVYEPPQGVACPTGVSCQPYSVTKSTGHHFSLYKN